MTSVILRNLNRKTLVLFVFNLLPTWVSVQFSSAVQSWLTLCNSMDCSTRLPCPSWTPRPCSNSYPLSQTHIRWVSDWVSLILCRPLLVLPSIFPGIRVFSSESILHIRWPKYCSFSTSPSNEYSGLISFRMDWLDLLAAQRTLKSLLQLQSSKISILRCSAFFMVQLSHPYMTIGEKKKEKNIALTRRTFVSKVVSLHFNMLSRFVVTFLPRSIF